MFNTIKLFIADSAHQFERLSGRQHLFVILGVCLTLILVQWSALDWNREWSADNLVALGALPGAIVLCYVLSKLSNVSHHGVRLARQVLSSRRRTWIVAFVLFETIMLYATYALAPLMPEAVRMTTGGEPTAMTAFVVGAGVLIAGRWWGGRSREDVTTDEPSSRTRPIWLTGISIFVLSLLVNAIFAFFTVPTTAGDSALYYAVSEQLYTHSPAQLELITYPYPLMIAFTRLFLNNALGLVVAQSLLRAVSAAVLFGALQTLDYWLGVICGVLVALDPISAHYAHLLLSESGYSSLITLLVAAVVLVMQNPKARVWGVAGGMVCGLVSLWRPAGSLLIAPVLLVALLSTGSWRSAGMLALGFVVSILILSAGQWLLTGHFRYAAGSEDDAYYVYPLFNLKLFDENNGPVAQQFSYVLGTEGCDYDFAQLNTQQGVGHFIQCSAAYEQEAQTDLSVLQLYVEAIRAKPITFAVNAWNEIRHYITHGHSAARTDLYEWVPNPVGIVNKSCDDQAALMNRFAVPSLREYLCVYRLPDSGLLDRVMLGWERVFVDVFFQPYRLQGYTVWARLWAALMLVAFVLLEGSRRARWIVALCVLIVGYHAAVTALAQWPIHRYVFVLSPVFVILTGILLRTLAGEALPPLARRSQTQAYEHP